MSDHSTVSSTADTWSQYAKRYDPIKIGSIDGTDTEPHDQGIVRALNSEYRPNRHVKGNPECTIFVARLSPKTTKDTIKDVFSRYGRLRRFRLVKDIVTGIPKGYAFIEYESERAAEDAYKKANRMYIDGQPIFVDFECERLLKGWKPRRLGGGFGGRKESGQLRFGGRDRPFRKPINLEIQETQQMDRDRREREYKRDERKRKHRDSLDREERSRHLQERNGNRDYRHNQDEDEYREQGRERRRKSPESSKGRSRERSEHREERNYRERLSNDLYENSADHDKSTKNTENGLDNRNGKN